MTGSRARTGGAVALFLFLAALAAPARAADVVCLAEHGGTVYAGTEEGLRARTDDGRLEPVGSSLRVTALAAGRDLWVGTSTGLYRLERGALVAIPLPGGVDSRVVALAVGAREEIWVSLAGALYRRSGGIWRSAGPDAGLVSAVWTRGQEVWIGTTLGAYRGARRLFDGPVRSIGAAGALGPVVFLLADGSIRSETGAALLAAGHGVRGVATGPGALWAWDAEGTLRGFSIASDGVFAASLGAAAEEGISAVLARPGPLLVAVGDRIERIESVTAEPPGGAPSGPGAATAAASGASAEAVRGGFSPLDTLYAIVPAFGDRVEAGILLGIGIGTGLLCLAFVWIFVRQGKKKDPKVVVVSRRSRTRKAAVLPQDLPLEVAGAVTKFRRLVERINEASVILTSGEIDDAVETEIRGMQAEFKETEKILRGLLLEHAADSRISALLRETLGDAAE